MQGPSAEENAQKVADLLCYELLGSDFVWRREQSKGIEDLKESARLLWFDEREMQPAYHAEYHSIRSNVVAALSELCKQLGADFVALEYAMTYADLVIGDLAKLLTHRQTMALAVGCFVVAVKFCEDTDVAANLFSISKIRALMSSFTTKTLVNAEAAVLQKLQWNLRVTTMTDYFNEYVSLGIYVTGDRYQDDCFCSNCQESAVREVIAKTEKLLDWAQSEGIVYLYAPNVTVAAAITKARLLAGVSNVTVTDSTTLLPSALAIRMRVDTLSLSHDAFLLAYHHLTSVVEKHERTQKKIAQVQQQAMDRCNAARKRARAVSTMTCCVCLQHDVSQVMIPCGHACLCTLCWSNSQNTCPMCRAEGKAYKLFI